MNRVLGSGPIVWLGIIVTTCLLLVLFQTALWLVLPVLLAVVAYYLLSPLVNAAMASGMTRGRAVLLVTALLCVFILALGVIVGPRVARASHDWRDKVGDYLQGGEKLVVNAQTTLSKMTPFIHHPVAPVLKEKNTVRQKNPSPAAIVVPDSKAVAAEEAKETAEATEALNDKVANVTATYSGDIALELAHWIPSLILIPCFTYYFLLDGPRFKHFLVQAIPNAFFEKALYLFYRIDDQLRRYFQGLLALTGLDAFCLGVGLWFLGFPAPFLLACVAAVMAWLPYLGSMGGCLLVVLVAAHHAPGSTWLPYATIGLFIGVRLLDDFVFLPMTVGRSLKLHPLVTILMIMLGGAVAGIAGLLLVMPVLGVVMVAGQIMGEFLTDERILARHRHAKELRRRRARTGLLEQG